MSARLEIRGLVLARGGRVLIDALELTLGAGEALHVAGPNGAGKSSLLRAIAGLLRPVAGTIDHDGVALADEALALDRELPLRRALAIWGKADRMNRAMAAFGLERLAEVPVRMLSTGQAKRARLARVAASDAKLWLLDEPLNGLDGDGTLRLAEAIAAHRTSGGAVVAASHVALPGAWRQIEVGT